MSGYLQGFEARGASCGGEMVMEMGPQVSRSSAARAAGKIFVPRHVTMIKESFTNWIYGDHTTIQGSKFVL